MTKPNHAGGEIDSYCTKCKLVLNHRIIAMVGGKPVRVECSTCSSHHNYRPRDTAAKVARASGAPKARTSARVTKSDAERLERERSWEKAVSGKLAKDFKRYAVSLTFHDGDLVQHAKFGDGVVLRVLDPHKVEILFRDEARTLAQGIG